MAPDTHGSTERHSAPTSAAPFFRGLTFALAAGLVLWAVVLLLAWWLA